MRNLFLLAVLLILTTANAFHKSWYVNYKSFKVTDICNGLECPKYVLKRKTDDYELRFYPGFLWVQTVSEGPKKQGREMFNRLLNYINGENEGNKKLAMTNPVVTSVEHGKGNPNRYTMLLFIPFKYQRFPPKPTNPKVSIGRVAPTCAYIRSYYGSFSRSLEEKNLQRLITSLRRDGVDDFVDAKEIYYTVWYASPFMYFYRLNEVALVQKSCK